MNGFLEDHRVGDLEDMLEGKASLLHIEEDGLLAAVDERPVDDIHRHNRVGDVEKEKYQ